MSLIYPVANDARAALTGPQGEARTKAEAREIAGGEVTLETDWLKPDPDEADDLSGAVQLAISHGAAQIYESDDGQPVVAVSYWKPVVIPEPVPAPAAEPAPASGPVREDHADDLYFRHGRTKKKKPEQVDPNQLDLFGAPKEPRPPAQTEGES